jgi:formamidopyrimidine-DNA glycosylase
MPELPEVETTCRGIRPHIVKQTIDKIIIRQRQLRWPAPDDLPRHLAGQPVIDVSRRAKYLLLTFPTGTILLHLGMSGSLRIVTPQTAAGKHDHVDFVFRHQHILRFNDPRKFGAILWTSEPVEQHPLLANLGPEPLSNAFTGDYLYRQANNRTISVKNFIMNNVIVVGVGNIYANESLFLAGIHPGRQAGRISLKRYQKLVDCIKTVLTQAIAQGGTTLKDFVNEQGKPGYFQQSLNIYGQTGQPCPHCHTIIQTIKTGQRSSFFCPQCQT